MNTTKKTKEKSTGLSVAGQFTQADIPTLLEKVNDKIKELSKGDKKQTEITVDLPGFGNVAKNESVMSLLQACSSVEGKCEAYKKSAEKYLPEGVKTPPLLINGHGVSAWLSFLQERIVEVAHKKELEKLRQIKSTLEENLSAEMKLANDLAKIGAILTEEE